MEVNEEYKLFGGGDFLEGSFFNHLISGTVFADDADSGIFSVIFLVVDVIAGMLQNQIVLFEPSQPSSYCLTANIHPY